MTSEVCPNCGETSVERIQADVGVCVVEGPLECYSCGWAETALGEFSVPFDDFNLEEQEKANESG